MSARLLLCCAVIACACASTARAQTVLQFDGLPFLEAFVEDLPGYGDNAPATPNITVDFDGLQFWDSGYGDLTNVAYVDSGAGISRDNFGTATITFTADAGHVVELLSLDLAGYGAPDNSYSFAVRDGGGNLLFSSLNPLAPGAGHNTLNFGALQGQQLILTITDATLDEVPAIDNVTFAQVVPEPAGLGLLALVLTAALRRRVR